MNTGDLGRVPSERLWTPEFIALNAICLLAFGTLSLFYGFYSFLAESGVDPAWRGTIISLFSLTALILRPMVSARLSSKSIMPSLFWGQLVCIAAMGGYWLLRSGSALAFVRLVHGAGYVFTLSAAVALLARILPPSRSGEGFSFNTIMALLPNAILPMLLEHWPDAFESGQVFAWSAICMLPGLAVLPLLRKSTMLNAEQEHHHVQEGIMVRIMAGIRQPGARALLSAYGLTFLAVVMIFFYIKSVCAMRGSGNPGVFLSLATWMVLATRVSLGPIFDRVDRRVFCLAGLFAMGSALTLPALIEGSAVIYIAALLYGLGMGITTPLLNALIFLVSRPDLRGLNANLMLQMLDLAYVIGPVVGGLLLYPSDGGSLIEPGGALFLGASSACLAAFLTITRGVRFSASGLGKAT